MLKKLKEKNEQRKARRRIKKKYGKGSKRPRKPQSEYGRISCLHAAVIAVLFFVMAAVAYIQKGNAAIYIGVAGIMAMLLSMFGISAGFHGLREREKAHMTSRVGVGLNTAFLLIFAVLFIGGLF